MDGSNIEREIAASLGHRAIGWQISASVDEHGSWVVSLAHSASHGLVIETGQAEAAEATQRVIEVLTSIEEIETASAAPVLEHPDLILDIRGLAEGFRWDHREVGSLAFLMFEHGHITEVEAAWLAGYIGLGAPRQPVSPVG